MLTNTVGIMLFILAFAVLVTGGAMVVRRLPIESEDDRKPILFLCERDKLVPVNSEIVEEHLGITNLIFSSKTQASACADRMNGTSAEDAYFTCTATTDGVLSGRMRDGSLVYLPDLTVQYSYKQGTGCPTNKLGETNSVFLMTLSANKPRDRFAFFYVRPDGLSTFWLAREIAGEHGFRSGWIPFARSNLLFGTGGGMSAKTQ